MLAACAASYRNKMSAAQWKTLENFLHERLERPPETSRIVSKLNNPKELFAEALMKKRSLPMLLAMLVWHSQSMALVPASYAVEIKVRFDRGEFELLECDKGRL